MFYILFQKVLNEEYDQKLHDRRNYALKQISKSDTLKIYQSYSSNLVSVFESTEYSEQEKVSDTIIFDLVEHRDLAYRQLTFFTKARGHTYKLQVRRPIPEKNVLIEGVVFLVLLLLVLLAVTLSLINSKIFKVMWRPFYEILDVIKNFRLNFSKPLEFKPSFVDEFDTLADSVSEMARKISEEYKIQKEFIENASHEIQTPLAIISNKMELLLQSPGLNAEQLDLVSSSISSVNRLSRLNEALLILARIENRQFHYVDDFCVNDLIEQHLGHWHELIQSKSLTVNRAYNQRLVALINPFLLDILLENIISNAIKHNAGKGFIDLNIQNSTLTVSNSGVEPTEPTHKLFQRFSKLDMKSKSLGLGLSIVKAVCDTYHFKVTYGYSNFVHSVSINFSSR